MTVRELAGAAGCSETTILRVARRTCSYRIRNGIRAEFDERESVKIMGEVRKRGFVTPRNQTSQPQQNAELVKSVFTAGVLRELVKIYGEKGAARRIDHVIGYGQEAKAPEITAVVPAAEAAPYFRKLYDELEKRTEQRKQLELFQVY